MRVNEKADSPAPGPVRGRTARPMRAEHEVFIMTDDFVVHDKRLFNKDGQVNPEATEESREQVTVEKPSPEPDIFGQTGSPLPPPANFPGLLVGLATSAFIHLGESPDQTDDHGHTDLAAAKHAIDLLGVLQAKTKGNLEEEEEALLTTLLYDLRLKYVQATAKK